MNRKPPILAELQYDRALAAVPHLVETINWLINYVANLKGQDGIYIQDSDTDHPTISINIEGQDGITVEKTDGQIIIKNNGSGGGGVKSVNEAVGEVKFVSADDSNLTFTKDGDTIKVGCYYV